MERNKEEKMCFVLANLYEEFRALSKQEKAEEKPLIAIFGISPRKHRFFTIKKERGCVIPYFTTIEKCYQFRGMLLEAGVKNINSYEIYPIKANEISLSNVFGWEVIRDIRVDEFQIIDLRDLGKYVFLDKKEKIK